jgi:hypothetical protein
LTRAPKVSLLATCLRRPKIATNAIPIELFREEFMARFS